MAVIQGDTRSSILDAARRIMARKGFSAVGINEVLSAAGVPKGSFYHFFGSKEAFGEALIRAYFTEYLAEMDRVLAEPGLTSAERLMNYWRGWREAQSVDECQGKCLVVKLAAEVSDLSESMRLALKEGTTAVIDRLEGAIAAGVKDGSIAVTDTPRDTAQALYDMWLGASVMVKVHRHIGLLDTTTRITRQLLHP
ncbi:TetR/AcrR family transcriptional regulator [Streptomyces sp. AJS327]|uniref:TetR/AcrR family transcriptional regulator n=1 Tax=Streptomyces sp. AJS327 TaxID=2545265 RepID=UPI0015DF470E|nr:TetR/AcrR family transcriptional regulator [Streptomyces sp. AJS327]MBA0049740.1 TetR/AcrR family transcriptional regulator [Streptomyces sp. AJS327]